MSDPRKAIVETNKLRKRLRREVGRAIIDYQMIEAGDRVMVCLSGGKDSYALLEILMNLRDSAPIDFEIVAMNVDQKQPGFPEHVLPQYLSALGVEFHIIEQDTYSVVKELTPEGKTYCPVCSRMRRGIIYNTAQRLGATKVALGHHREDAIETLFLNMFFQGKLKAMPPKLRSDDGRNLLIRPLIYVRERDLARFAELREYPIIPCTLCGSQENAQRQRIKAMLADWEQQFPGRIDNIARSLTSVKPSQLADRDLFDFANLRADALDSGASQKDQSDQYERIDVVQSL